MILWTHNKSKHMIAHSPTYFIKIGKDKGFARQDIFEKKSCHAGISIGQWT
jgi:hypothetical protein